MKLQKDFYETLRVVSRKEDNQDLWAIFELDKEKGYRLIHYDSNKGEVLSEAKFCVTNIDLSKI